MNNNKIVVFYGDSVLENSNYVKFTTAYCLEYISKYKVINKAIDGNTITYTFECLNKNKNYLSNDVNGDVAVLSLGGNDLFFNFAYLIKTNDWSKIYKSFLNNFINSKNKLSIVDMYKSIIKKLCKEYKHVVVLSVYNPYMFWNFINDIQKELCHVFVNHFNDLISNYCEYLNQSENFMIDYINLYFNSEKFFIFDIEPSEDGSILIANEIFKRINN